MLRILLATAAAAAALLAPVDGLAEGVTFLHTAPKKARAGRDLALSGNLFGGGDVERVEARFRSEGERTWRSAGLELVSGDLWKGSIPGSEVRGAALEYYLLAIDLDGAEEAVWATKAQPERVAISGALPPLRRPPDPDPDPEPVPTPEPVPDRPVVEDPPEDERPKDRPRSHGGLEDELLLFGSEETVSLATLSETPVAEAPAIVSVITREEIRAFGFRTAADVLKALPGFETSRDVQGHDRVAVRGIRSDPEILVLYDGHELNNPYDARALLRIPAENLERVEAIRGPGSALYGAGAFLGVVNLVPRREKGGSFAAEAGTRPFAGGHALYTLEGERTRLYLDADVVRSFSYGKEIAEDSLTVTGDLQRQGLVEEGAPLGPVGDDGLLLNVGAAGALTVGEHGEAQASLRFLRDSRSPILGAFDSYGVPGSDLLWQLVLLDVKYTQRFGESVTADARLFFDQQDVTRRFQLAPAGVIPDAEVFPEGALEETAFTTRSYGATGQGTFAFAKTNTLTVGLSWSEDRLSSYLYRTNFEGGTPLPAPAEPEGIEFPQKAGPSRRVIGAFAQDQWRLVDPLVLTAGARIDATDGYDPAVSPRVGLVFAATTTTKLKLLYGSAFRAPTFQELTDRIPNSDFNQGRFEGAPGLKPVTITTFEGGVEQVFAALDSKVRVRGDAFYNLFRNRIEAVDTSGNLPQLQNRETGVDTIGAELEARIVRGPRSFTVLNFSWFRTRDNNPDIPVELHLLTDVPQYRINLGTQIPLASFVNLSGLLQLGAERRNNSRSRLETLRRWSIPAYSLLSAQLATEEFAGGFSVALVGENLLDEDYRDDVPRPDRVTGQLPREGVSGLLIVRRSLAP